MELVLIAIFILALCLPSRLPKSKPVIGRDQVRVSFELPSASQSVRSLYGGRLNVINVAREPSGSGTKAFLVVIPAGAGSATSRETFYFMHAEGLMDFARVVATGCPGEKLTLHAPIVAPGAEARKTATFSIPKYASTS